MLINYICVSETTGRANQAKIGRPIIWTVLKKLSIFTYDYKLLTNFNIIWIISFCKS